MQAVSVLVGKIFSIFFYWVVLIVIAVSLLIQNGYAEDIQNEGKAEETFGEGEEPKEITDGEMMVSVKVNYQDADNLSTIIRNPLNNLLILAEDMQPFKIQESYLEEAIQVVNEKRYINLDLLEGTKYKVDNENLSLEIIVPAQKMKLQQFDATAGLPPIDAEFLAKSASGFFLNYDVTVSNSNNTSYASGIQDIDYFTESDKGVLYTNFFVKANLESRKSAGGGLQTGNTFVRLMSNWTFDDADKMTKWRVGDGITQAADWSGSTRFLGLQYSTNFAIRPGLITYPLMNFLGRAELPTTLEVYANSLPIYQTDAKMGDFNIENLPITTGKGELIVKAKDMNGRINTIVLPYYNTPLLLKTGLSDFSFEGGFQRQYYGVSSNKYKYFLANANYKHGVNDYWTPAAHFELMEKQATIGTTHYLKLGNYGIISASLASNVHQFSGAQKYSLGYSYQALNYSFNSTVTDNGKNYVDVYNPQTSQSSSPAYQISGGYNNEKWGSIFLGYNTFASTNANNQTIKARMLTCSYEKSFNKDTSLRLNLGADLTQVKKSSFVVVSMYVNLGSKNLSLSNSNQNGVSVKEFSLSSPVTTNLGWGYRANLMKGLTMDYDLQLDRKGQHGDASLYLYRYSGQSTQQFSLMGGAVFMDKHFYLARPIYDSVVLVKTGGIKDVPVYSNNMLVGTTDSKGSILVPEVWAYTRSEIWIDPKKMPLDADFTSLTAVVIPKRRSGMIVDYKINRVKSAEMVLLDRAGKTIAFDKDVVVEGVEEGLFVGYDGVLYINNIGKLTSLKGKVGSDEDSCHFDVPLDGHLSDPMIDLGEVICR